MNRMPIHHMNPSTYVGILLWGVVAFGIQPTFGSFVVHFGITPVVIVALIALCHWEGRNQVKPTDRA